MFTHNLYSYTSLLLTGDLCTTPAYGPHDEENWASRTLPYSYFFASSSKHPTNFKETESDSSFWVWHKQKENIVKPKEWMALLGKEMPSFQEVLEDRFTRRFPSKGPQWLLCHPGTQAMSSPTRSVYLSPGKGTLSWISDLGPKGSSYYTVFDVKLLYIASTTPTCFWVLFTSH